MYKKIDNNIVISVKNLKTWVELKIMICPEGGGVGYTDLS